MKRKRLDRDGWMLDRYPYYQLRVDLEDFHGLVCLIRLLDGQNQYWDRPKAGKVAVCGAGMTWLQLIPDGKHHVLTAKYLPDQRVSVWYADVIETIEYDADGVAVFIDKYLDVVFTPQGDVGIDDRDELDEAYQSGELTRGQYESALCECEHMLEDLCADIAKTEALCARILAHVNDKIAKGEKPFKQAPRQNVGDNRLILFETERLRMRQFAETDAEALFRHHHQDDLKKWIPNESYANMQEAQGAIAFYRQCINQGDLPYVLAIEAKVEKRLIGDVGINAVEGKVGEIEIGFSVSKEFQCKDYATEAVNAMVQFAAKHFGAKSLHARIMKGNHRSVKVVEKCGFSFVTEEFDAQDDAYGNGMLIYTKEVRP